MLMSWSSSDPSSFSFSSSLDGSKGGVFVLVVWGGLALVLGRVEEGEGGGVGWAITLDWEGMIPCWEDRMVVGESKWEGWRVGGGLSTATFRGLEAVAIEIEVIRLGVCFLPFGRSFEKKPSGESWVDLGGDDSKDSGVTWIGWGSPFPSNSSLLGVGRIEIGEG